MSKLIGITGTIGSGKSTVGAILELKNIPVIDTDKLVHTLLASDKPTKDAILNRFGTLDRKRLGEIVFNDATARKDLEAILHPAVIEMCRQKVKELASKPVIAFLVPLLFEAGLENEYDEIWTVVVDEPILRERLSKRDNFTEAQLDARLGAQLPQSEKSKRAHHIINNSKSLQNTQAQVEKLLGL